MQCFPQGTVYLVLGSDTAIWEGMNTSRYNNYYNLGLYTDPARNAYKVMDPAFRNQIVDSYGTPVKLTWWMMAGNIFRYATNRNVPVPNIMTLHLMKRFHLESIEEFGDELSLHYHTFDWFDYSGDGKFWWNQTETFMQLKEDWDVTLAQFLLEENIFPVSFRSGWHYMDNGWQQVLDELLPYSMHNDWPAKRKDTTEPLDNTYDWSRAPSEFIPFRPSPDDYQVPGDGKGWNVRSLFFGRVTQELMDGIFEKANNGIDQVVCLWAHLPETDFLDNIEKVNTHAHAAAEKYPEVTFRYDTAVEAMQRWRGLYGETPPQVTLEDIPSGDNVHFRVHTDKPIFQTYPFVALKDIYENYLIVPMQETGTYEWTSVESYPAGRFAKVAVAVTDTTGNLETRFLQYLPEDIYVDIGEGGYTERFGAWTTSTQSAWFNEGRYATISGNDSASVGWSIPIDEPGRYNVFLQVPAMNAITDSLSIAIHQNGGSSETIAFSHFTPDDWDYLTTIEFDHETILDIALTGYASSGNSVVLPAPVIKISPLVRDRELHAEPGFLNIGEVSQNDTVEVDLHLTNRGIEPLHITNISSTDGNVDVAITLPVDLAPMHRITIPLVFHATTIQSLVDTIVIQSNDHMRPVYKIPFSADVRLYFKIVDNEDSVNYREEGSWATSVAQAYGPSSRFSYVQNTGASAFFKAVLNFTGIYTIHQIVPTTVNAVNNALYIISMNGTDLDSAYVDQNLNSGTWVPVFETHLQAGTTVQVKVTNDGTSTEGAVLRADAIRFSLKVEGVYVEDNNSRWLPDRIALRQNYPNPFNPTTTISYILPHRMHVSLKVYDMLGREVTTLVREEQNEGEHVILFNAARLPSGTYFYQLQADDFNETRKLILLR
jgi:hypothetical protein